MNGIVPEPRQPVEERENWRTTIEAIDDTYFVHWISPGDGALSGAGVVHDATGNYPYVLMPDAVSGVWRVNLRLRPRWNGCGIYLKFYYTSDVGSANNFTITFLGRVARVGTVLSAPVQIFTSGSTAVAGPAVAQTVKTVEYVNPGAMIGTYYDLLSILILRSGAADANNNQLWLLGYELKILEPRT